MAQKNNILAAAGCAPETIIVGLPNVSGKGRQRDYTPPFMRMDIDEADSPMGEGDTFLTFMEKELFPMMEKNYATSGIRTLAGNSRGGLLVLYSLLYKPHLFQGRLAFSPALWRDEHAICKQAAQLLPAAKGEESSFLFMSLGDEENTKMKAGFIDMMKVLERNASTHLVWQAEFTPKANHQSNADLSAAKAIRAWADFSLLNINIDYCQNKIGESIGFYPQSSPWFSFLFY
ncbi:alpha/beta hydrolase [Shiella aurantiaca]|uniref:alpha/beta hydrolase n=1 Tax=Shiella aurantiaca TaxID=3058365 RepID=UPI0029F4A09B|nr:alpha/beta hydrolase-fold protein [Shiella aurantiaca]